MALTDNLISYWKLDEASGNALDAHGSNNLAEASGTIAAGTGKINGARDFEAGDTELFWIADNTDLSTGDIDFTVSAWINIELFPSTGTIVGKYDAVGSRAEWRLVVNSATSQVRFTVSSNGVATTNINATTFGTLSTGTWYHVVAWHDSVNNEIGISVNGTADTASYSSGVADTLAPFSIGCSFAAGGSYPVGAQLYFDGLIDEVGFWRRVLTSGERSELYNSGSGLAYPFAVAHLLEGATTATLTTDGLIGLGRPLEANTEAALTASGELTLAVGFSGDCSGLLTTSGLVALGFSLEGISETVLTTGADPSLLLGVTGESAAALTTEGLLTVLSNLRIYNTHAPDTAKLPYTVFTIKPTNFSSYLGGARGYASCDITFNIVATSHSEATRIAGRIHSKLSGFSGWMGLNNIHNSELSDSWDETVETDTTHYCTRSLVFELQYEVAQPLCQFEASTSTEEFEISLVNYLSPLAVYQGALPRSYNGSGAIIYSRIGGNDSSWLTGVTSLDSVYKFTIVGNTKKTCLDLAILLRNKLDGVVGNVEGANVLEGELTDQSEHYQLNHGGKALMAIDQRYNFSVESE